MSWNIASTRSPNDRVSIRKSEHLAGEFAKRMMEKGVYVVAFSYPVVPKGKARIRTQVCASHTKEDIDFIVKCFKEVREEMGLETK